MDRWYVEYRLRHVRQLREPWRRSQTRRRRMDKKPGGRYRESCYRPVYSMQLMTQVLCSLTVLCGYGCVDDGRKIAENQTANESSVHSTNGDLRRLIYPMMSYRTTTGSRRFDVAIAELLSRSCGSSPTNCEYTKRDFWSGLRLDVQRAPTDGVGRVALALAIDPDTRWIAKLVACGICAEVGRQCLCEGHSCELDEMVPNTVLVVPAWIECGAMVVDGVEVPWGREVRRIDNLFWAPSPLLKRTR